VRWLRRVVQTAEPAAPISTIRQYRGFLQQWRQFHAAGGEAAIAEWDVRLGDATATTGFDPHYVYQLVWALERIGRASPDAHVDVASQVDLVSVLTITTPVVAVDIRPLLLSLDRYSPVRGSLDGLPFATGSVPSLSCLHVLEHIGLGRYGDAVDPAGTASACAELARVVAPGGALLVSVPVGRPRTCFNAHRVLDAEAFPALFPDCSLAGFALVDDDGRFHRAAEPAAARGLSYGCGMFSLTK
jgi:SAM-dependent methyltransferase